MYFNQLLQVSKTRISTTTQTRTMCNAETQTDETDFYLMYQVGKRKTPVTVRFIVYSEGPR